MSAVLRPAVPTPKPVADFLEQEFLIIGNREGHSLTGCEIGLGAALACARGLAFAGWRVTVRSADPYLVDPLVMEVWSEDAPA